MHSVYTASALIAQASPLGGNACTMFLGKSLIACRPACAPFFEKEAESDPRPRKPETEKIKE